ncbi:hypothetical protein CDD81_3695 [Ophiocordyceps australis]|uniref:Uncharacterized protein n=1 Tax=Ophiocordyceps australis TaxID=1399860 RepID=A0A2C5XRR1_9HYPO|nr:hypothetical protein CDD81_3695 [Ophiocordyceps australis]
MAKRVVDISVSPIIDLTGDDDDNDDDDKDNKKSTLTSLVVRSSQPKPLPPGDSVPRVSKRADRNASLDEPPAKRRCRNEDDSPQKLKAWAQEKIFPLVVEAVRDLRKQEYLVEKIVISAVTQLVRKSELRERWDANNGLPPSLAHNDALSIARRVVDELKEKPCFQVRPLKPTIIPSVEIKRIARRPTWKPRVSRLVACGSDIPKVPWRQGSEAPKYINRLFGLKKRPYLSATDRQTIRDRIKDNFSHDEIAGPLNAVYHVDFSQDEVAQVLHSLGRYLDVDGLTSRRDLAAICQSHNVASLVGSCIEGRSSEDIRRFCSDLLAGQAVDAHKPRLLSLQRLECNAHEWRNEKRVAGGLSRLLFARELEGNAGFGRTRCYVNFQDECRKMRHDGFSLIGEFTNCAGDISTMTWLPGENIICGTTAHSDSHNQQYNKQGNLLLCSARLGTLRALADHRIPRPLVDRGENSTDAMRQSQDAWLYSSVVSSDYDEARGQAFTSSFDWTVKVWKVADEGREMEAVATWQHQGNVNFVAAAKNGSGHVATAADVPKDAVRVYTVNADKVAESPFITISCSRTDANESNGKWAYYPATMQWGSAHGTKHLLLVGYSPRSLKGDESDIPEDKRNSGEILLWDSLTRRLVPVLTASTANVFEVAWHPTLPRFIAATSPCGLHVEARVRTQVHLFQQDFSRPDSPAYSEIQKLDCPAADINELTIKPNSRKHAYVTAACTDGRVYVWDTALGDDPIHVLAHGHPLDHFSQDREKEDTGVKLTAWGNTLDRFYTGSSDGVVKVWNVRNLDKPFVRNLVEAPGSISCGAFSPDGYKLAMGDATGRVFIFSADKRDEYPGHKTTVAGRTVRRPQPFISHPEPPPPPGCSAGHGQTIAMYARKTFVESGQLVLHRNPVIGAVQGPWYSTTGMFRIEAHLDEDPAAPLLTEFARKQRESEHATQGLSRRSFRRLRNPVEAGQTSDAQLRYQEQHARNMECDLVQGLRRQDPALWRSLCREGALLEADEDWGFCYEEMPDDLA